MIEFAIEFASSRLISVACLGVELYLYLCIRAHIMQDTPGGLDNDHWRCTGYTDDQYVVNASTGQSRYRRGS